MSIFGGLFWGILFLAAGLVIMLKLVFNLQFSAGRMIFGVFVILVGISLLIGVPGWGSVQVDNGNVTMFSEGGQSTVTASDNYTTVFGSKTYDVQAKPGDHVRINCAFGSCNIIVHSGNVYLKVTNVCCSISVPGGYDMPFVGTRSIGDDDPNAVTIEIAGAFGSVNVSQAS